MKTVWVLAAFTGLALAQHEDHHAGVLKRGDHEMGFSHERTTHHFRLLADGGAIEVETKDPADTASRNQILGHFRHITQMFAEGNFKTPMLIHDQAPPGVPVMKERKDRIQYRLETTPRGGRIRITTADPEALEAVHQFLRFQITDHKTGDPTVVQK